MAHLVYITFFFLFISVCAWNMPTFPWIFYTYIFMLIAINSNIRLWNKKYKKKSWEAINTISNQIFAFFPQYSIWICFENCWGNISFALIMYTSWQCRKDDALKMIKFVIKTQIRCQSVTKNNFLRNYVKK